jgi:hypothetical protein
MFIKYAIILISPTLIFLFFLYFINKIRKMGKVTTATKSNGVSMYVILHQIGFLSTGLCTTLGVQWLFYRGAASKV